MTTDSPQVIADRWAQRAAGAGEKTKAGVLAVQVSPTEKAAQRADAYLAGVQRAVSDGKYQRGLMRVTLQDWKDAMIDKGIPRIGTGVNAAKGKFAAFMGELLPHVANIQRQLESMPRGDLEQNIARANFVMREMANFRRSGR